MGLRWGIIFNNDKFTSERVSFIKNKLIIIIGSIVFLLAVAYIIYSLSTSGLFSSPSTPESRVMTTEIHLDNLGSAARLEGNVAIVSIFANDKKNTWDFSTAEDKQARENMFSYTDIAVKWLCEQAKNYNKELSFSYAENEQSDLYFETALDDDCMDLQKSFDKSAPVEWEYIDKNIDSKAIKEKYGCDSVVYFIFVNQTDESGAAAYALSVYNKAFPYPYEICFIPVNFGGTITAPSVIAHELLHTFGAPDLYTYDGYDNNYGTTLEYKDYCQEYAPNDIMLTTFTKIDGISTKLTDRIDNEITEITAYYISWLDDPPPEVDEFGLVHNQYENYNG